MINFQSKATYNVYDLEQLVACLRGEGGCPWDAVQTHESIRRNLLEEAYEAAEAIDEGSSEHLREELGDVLLQVVFHARIEQEEGRFTLDDVADGVCKKLIYRHPHVFAGLEVDGKEQVLRNWDELKKKEKQQTTVGDTLRAVAASLPALWRADKLLSKAGKAGLEKEERETAKQALSEAAQALSAAEEQDAFEALGELLFAAVRMGRLQNVDPEDALHAACLRYIARMEREEQSEHADF